MAAGQHNRGGSQRSRLSRRSFVGGLTLGGAGLSAAFLAACGGSTNNSSNTSSTNTSSNNTSSNTAGNTSSRPAATAAAGVAQTAVAAAGAARTATAAGTTRAPTKGGTYNNVATNDIPSIDPYASASAATKTYAGFVYSRLFRFAVAPLNAQGVLSQRMVEGDAAASSELSPDGLTYTIKLKPNVKWHAPISRPFDSSDVVFSWQRFTGQTPGGKPAPSSDRVRFIQSVQAPDAQTVVFKLASPFGPFIELLADATLLYIMPKETGTAFDPAQSMVGSGPWVFEKYAPGSVLSFTRNPNWHFGPDKPYLDRYVINVVKDVATRLNQFLAGNLDSYGANGIDMAQIKQTIPNVQVVMSDTGLDGATGFAQVSNMRANAAWTDVRVRRALSMAIDRDAIVNVAYNPDQFKSAGVNVTWGWQGILPGAFGDFAIDPKADPTISQYFKYDPKSAKALIDQAGGGFSTDLHYYNLAQEEVTIAQVTSKYWSDIGVKTNIVLDDYASVFIPHTYQGDFTGMAAQSGFVAQVDPGLNLTTYFQKDATNNFSKVNDPRVESDLPSYFAEPDAEKRKSLIQNLQKYLLPLMYYMPNQWGALPAVTCARPAVGNLNLGSTGYGALGQTSTEVFKS